MRRILLVAIATAALLLTQAAVVPSQADPAPTVVETVPAPLAATGAAMVTGPEDVPSGRGSLRFESLGFSQTSNLIGVTFDAWIYLPATTRATVVMPWSYYPEYDYVLTFTIPAVTGWQRFEVTGSTPVTWSSRVLGSSGTVSLLDLWNCCPGQVSGATIQLTSTDGSTPRAYLDTLRSAVGSYDFEPTQRPTISSAVTTVTYGNPVTIRGTVLAGDGVALAGAPATLSQRPTGAATFTTVDRVVTSDSGRLASEETPTRTTTYRWTGLRGLLSPARTITVAPAITARVADTSVARGRRLVVRGTVLPKLQGLSVQLMRSGSGRPIASTPVRRDGSYTFSVLAPRGTYLVWPRTSATTGYVAGAGRQALVTVS